VAVSGTASDNLGVALIELVTDGYRRTPVFSAGGAGAPSVNWSAAVELAEGSHTLEAVATDTSGNTASARCEVAIDTTAPRIRIDRPGNGSITNFSIITVSGYMEPGVRVLVAGSPVSTVRDTFSGTVVLSEGENPVVATAIDRAGNSGTSSVRVILDTRAPALTVDHPPDGLRTATPVTDVSGTMEPGSEVTVNGRAVALTGPAGTFHTAISLGREVNFITVDAVDAAGNHNLTVRRVVLDTRPPVLELGYPPEGMITPLSVITLAGVSEGGADLSSGGVTIPVPGPDGEPAGFNLTAHLTEGLNTLMLTARDAAGNLNSTVRHVVLDTLSPAIVISSPAPGLLTTRSSIYVTGETEPGVRLSVNGREVPVGLQGSFSIELSISTGANRILARAVDAAGNINEARTMVNRTAAPAEDIVAPAAGPDWPFLAFIMIAAVAVVADGYCALRVLGRKVGGHGG